MIEQTFSVSGPTDLDVSVSSGSIVVEAGPPGSVEITVDTNRPDIWRLIQHGDSIGVSTEKTGFGRGDRARIRVVAPEGSSLRAAAASAEVRARLSLERVTVASASGDVLLGDAVSANVKTASGNISLGSVQDDLTVRSASGDLRLRKVGGPASITTASGGITIEMAAGSFRASSASGDIRVDHYLGDDAEASTMSGEIGLGLPSGIGVSLNAKTLSGKVHLPEKRKAPASPDRQVSLRLRSVSGDIRIHRAD